MNVGGRLPHPAWRFATDRRGVAAVEFALIFPLMITLLMGLCDLGEALISDRMTVEAAEAMVRGGNALLVPAQCTVSSGSQSCTPASLSSDSVNTLANVVKITMSGSSLAGTNFAKLDAVIYRVVNQNGTYTIANTFVIVGSGNHSFSPSSLKNYLPVGGSTLVASIKYEQTLLFPFFKFPITLTTLYTL